MSGLGSQRVSKLVLSIGLTGTWRGEVWCDEGQAPTGDLTLTVGDLVLRGAASIGGTDAPDAPHLIHEGARGWELEVSASDLTYENANGVRLRTVLTDLAKRAGEPIELPRDVNLGKHWCVIATRAGARLTLRDALDALVAGRYVQPWRVDLDGVTRFGERTGGAVDVDAVTVIRRDEAHGYAIVGADAFLALLPGATFEGHTITRLVITERPGNLQAEVWTRAPSAMTSIMRKVSRSFPQLVYGHPRTYRVGAVATDGRLDLDAPADAPHLPALRKVEVWGIGGAKVKPTIGSLAIVVFRDALPSRPVVVALQPLDASTPTETNIDADAIKLGAAAATVLRSGDYVALDTVTAPGRTIITLDGLGAPAPADSKVKA